MIRSLARLTAALLILASAAAFAIGVAVERQSETAEHAAEQPPATTSPVPETSPTPTPTSAAPTTTARATDRDAEHGRDSDHGAEHHGAEHHTTATTPATTATEAPTTSASGAVAAGQGDADADGGHDQDADGGHESAGEASPAAEHSELLFGVNLESTGLVVAAVVVSVLLAVAVLTLGMPWLAGVITVVMLAFAALDVREILHQLGESRLELAAIAILVALLHVLAAVAAGYVARTAYVHRNRATTNVG